MTKALIDGDNIAIACAASAGDDSELFVATGRTNDMLEQILHAVGATEYEVWLSGSNNFRYNVYPEYKADRYDAKRPRWEKEVKKYLVDHWQANTSDGCEADDMLGVRQCAEIGTIVCHLDKDINMIPGRHYNWELNRLGKTVRAAKEYVVTPEEAIRFFYYQMLIGDPTDHIKGVPGIGPKKAEVILNSVEANEEKYFQVVRELYGSDEEMEMNGKVLWIWRRMNDIWSLPTYDTTRGESQGETVATTST